MSTLILRLAAPMQSWGADSKYNYRKTGREPTKSGVLGMAAAALGCRRDDTEILAELNRLRFGVRVDHEGTMLKDFHMVHRPLKNGKEESTLTYRYYLCDAVFVVGLEGGRQELEQLEAAFRNPVYPLFLGRRSCPPTGRVCLGIEEDDLEEALKNVPWQLPHWRQKRADRSLRMVLDSGSGIAQAKDVPVSFSPIRREYGYRNIKEEWFRLPDDGETEHDPMAEL